MDLRDARCDEDGSSEENMQDDAANAEDDLVEDYRAHRSIEPEKQVLESKPTVICL